MPGVLEKIAGQFSKSNLSIAEVKQVAISEGNAQIVIITHVCNESAINKTLSKISKLEEVVGVNASIRIED